MNSKLFLATDHAGFEHKNFLRDYLSGKESFPYEVIDLGAFVYDPDDDYPHYIARAARRVADNPDIHRAIVFGGSGQGEAIVANKHNNIRATVYYGYEESILVSRESTTTLTYFQLGHVLLTNKTSRDWWMFGWRTPLTHNHDTSAGSDLSTSSKKNVFGKDLSHAFVTLHRYD